MLDASTDHHSLKNARFFDDTIKWYPRDALFTIFSSNESRIKTEEWIHIVVDKSLSKLLYPQ